MKTATLPSLRVEPEPELREAAENVLQAGETLSSFVETAVRESIERRRTRAEFIARGLASADEARRTGEYHAAADVHAVLSSKLDQARSRLRRRNEA